MNKVFLALGAVVSTVVGICRLAVRTAAVIAVLVVFSTAFLLAPQYMPVPNAWAEYSSGALKALSTVSGAPENLDSTTGALHTFEAYAGAGERDEGSTTGTDYRSTSEECGMSAEIDLSNNASTTVYAGPAVLCGYRMVVTVSGAAATIDDNATAKMTVPIAWPVGEHHVEGAIFMTNLIVNPDDASVGTIQLRYRPLKVTGTRAVTWYP